MQIDRERVRVERERRAWTQAHLAGAAGIGLRTVQRIERTGSASFESAQALAAALELSIHELRQEIVETPRLEKPAFPLVARLVVAAISGAAVAIWLDWRGGILMLYRGPFFASVIDFVVPGCLFAVGVLLPQLQARHTFVRRAFALAAASSLSYFVAVMIAIEGPDRFAFLQGQLSPNSGTISSSSLSLASIAGACIALAASRWVIQVEHPVRFWVAGVFAASACGGIAHIFIALFPPFMWFALWHISLFLAIQIGRSDEHGESAIRFSWITSLVSLARDLLPGGKYWRHGISRQRT